MTHNVILLKPQTPRKYVGHSNDPKPELGPNDTSAEFYEEDTKDVYIWIVDDWIRTLTGGLPSIKPQDHHANGELHDTMEAILGQLKILNTYMSLAHGEKLTIGDTGEE